MTQLSTNFYLAEMLKSSVAARLGRAVEAPPEVVANLKRAALTVWQPIRDELTKHYGKDMPIVTSSGYRPKWLNTMIGGSKTSDHIEGLALDCNALYLPTYEFVEFIRDRIHLFPVQQLIYEYGEWVHISAPRLAHDPKRQVLTAVKNKAGKTVYLNGLVKGD